MNENDFKRIALETAKKSKAKKRKVGAVLVINGAIVGEGCNYHPEGLQCESELGITVPEVIHAEVAAINSFRQDPLSSLYTNYIDQIHEAVMYVTHEPCSKCLIALRDAEIPKFVIVDTFMKFDDNKLRYDLIPPGVLKQIARHYTDNPKSTHIATMVDELVPYEAIQAMEDVLRYGAKKYKPNNWKEVDDPQRYVAALYRHLEAWRGDEVFDEESGLHHLHHAITNIAFLTYITKGNTQND
jgi:deoxycytidylate deaminase